VREFIFRNKVTLSATGWTTAMATLVGITDQLMQRLQAVQNAAARLIVGARKFDPVSRILHWLPVRQRITFKL